MRRLLAAIVITISIASVSHAETKWYDDWMVYTDDPTRMLATTMNDSKHSLTQMCDIGESSCYWTLVIATGCEKGHKYPALVSSDAGAAPIELVCFDKPTENRHRYAITSFDDFDKVVRAAQRIAIAFPLSNSDEFRVVRFSLNGAVQALNIMRAQAQKKIDAQPANTKDRKI